MCSKTHDSEHAALYAIQSYLKLQHEFKDNTVHHALNKPETHKLWDLVPSSRSDYWRLSMSS